MGSTDIAPMRRLALRRELELADSIPYTSHVAPDVVRTSAGHFLFVFQLAGASFETAADTTVNDCHERLNMLWRTVASPQVALWTHVVRRTVVAPRSAQRVTGFAGSLQELYDARLAGERLLSNDLYLSVLVRPASGDSSRWPLRRTGRRDAARAQSELKGGLEACAQLAEQIASGLRRYEPERLGIYSRKGRLYSSLLEFLALLVNGERQPISIPHGPIGAVLATSRVYFGAEAVEYRLPAGRRLGAVLAIKEYPTPTTPGLLNGLLATSYPYVLTQSFAFLPKATAQGLLNRQYNRLTNSGDLAVSQARALRVALDQLTSNEFVLGDHHLSLQVMTDVAAAEDDQAGQLWRALETAVADARIRLGDAGIVAAREDLALESAFWAQLPGNFRARPRRSPISSRNFAALSAMHNFPTGRAQGNHWGEALAVLKTSSGSPYYLSLHASDPRDPDGGSRKDTGHTFLCGPTGSGKTVFLGFCIAQLTRQGVTQIVLDKDHGLEVLVRALGGEYRSLEGGQPTGLNPLQLPGEPADLEFLRSWLARLASPGGDPLSARQEAELALALEGTLALPVPSRQLSRVLEFLDPTDPSGLHGRIARWCAAAGGDYAWVFDQPEDRVVPLLGAHPVIGFDVSDMLRNPALRVPTTMYLFHLFRRLIDGRRLVVWMDEFATLLDDPAFTAFAKDGLKTWRKMNAVAGFATQSPADVLQCSIARTLLEQTPTKIFFPNPDADRREYVDGLGLSSREYELVHQHLAPGSRRFLVKQGSASVVCELDLKGMDLELRVISGRTATVRRVRALIASEGSEPHRWLEKLAAVREDS
jgi:type IV secretion system protein VirB4